LDGLTPALHVGGKHILLRHGRIDRMLDETLTWSFIDLGVDGLVLAGSIPMSQAIIDAASQIPTVAVGGRGLGVALPRADILANDNHLGGTLAVRHLIELGHTRIGHIHGLPSVAGRLRMQGYEDTIRAAGLGDYVHIEAGDMSEEGGYRATVRLLSGQDRPTAIFAANDLTCVGALSAAAALGVRVPGELSLVGYDNSVFARLRALWLTSVDATAFELGQRAARMLLTRIERPEAPGETVLLPPRLEGRGSRGPAPAGRERSSASEALLPGLLLRTSRIQGNRRGQAERPEQLRVEERDDPRDPRRGDRWHRHRVSAVRPVRLALVGRERRLPVSPDRDEPEPSGCGEHRGRGEEAHHVRPTGEPGQQRRHLQRDILPQQLRQPAHVGVLEGRGEPVQQR